MAEIELGTARLVPGTDLVAGSMASFQLVYLASAPIAAGGGIRISTDSDTDWGIPQFDDASAAEYMTATAPEGVGLSLLTVGARGVRLQLHGRPLQPGEELTVCWGDQSQGSPGSRVQTFAEQYRFFTVDVDLAGDDRWQVMPGPPHVAVVGGEAAAIKLVAPSMAILGEPFRLIVKVEDAWGNPASSFTGQLQLSSELVAFGPVLEMTAGDQGVRHLEGLLASNVGIDRVIAHCHYLELSATSNPIEVTGQAAGHQLFWADPHGGQVVLNSKIATFFKYARDVAGLQFVGYQRNADAISVEDWQVQQEDERRLLEPGRFVPIPGFEWSGRTSQGGHHNVYFRQHDQPVRRNRPVEVPESVEAATELETSLDLFNAYRGQEVIITPHVGGEHSDIDHHDPTLEPAVEIVSTHGTFEWMLEDAIERGYQLGVLGGSDCYTARPGDDRPGYQLRRYSKGGVTGIYCQDVTLDSFFEAMRARRVFATSGPRMIVALEADGHWMGESYATTVPPSFTGRVEGTGPLESVQLYRGLEPQYECPLTTNFDENRVRLLWRGVSRKTSYAGVVWDGRLEVENARILAVETIRFESPRSHISEQTERSIEWTAWGCGYPMGLVLELDDPSAAEIQLAVRSRVLSGPGYGGHGEAGPRRVSLADAERATVSVRVAELADEDIQLDLGMRGRQIQLGLLPECQSTSARLAWTDPDPQPGWQPYWLRVVQADQEMAWSSPLFVEYGESFEDRQDA